MAEQQLYDPTQATLHYEPFEFSETGSSQRMGKKTRSHVSTRKGSADSLDLRVKFKTEICKYYKLNTECPFSELCSFAHGQEELRAKDFLPQKYKTKKCTKFNEDGFCPYGQRCQFIHVQGNHVINYQRLVETIRNDSEVFYQFFNKSQVKKPRRLSFFEQMEAVEETEEKAEEQVQIQMFVNRTRHNSV